MVAPFRVRNIYYLLCSKFLHLWLSATMSWCTPLHYQMSGAFTVFYPEWWLSSPDLRGFIFFLFTNTFCFLLLSSTYAPHILSQFNGITYFHPLGNLRIIFLFCFIFCLWLDNVNWFAFGFSGSLFCLMWYLFSSGLKHLLSMSWYGLKAARSDH